MRRGSGNGNSLHHSSRIPFAERRAHVGTAHTTHSQLLGKYQRSTLGGLNLNTLIRPADNNSNCFRMHSVG